MKRIDKLSLLRQLVGGQVNAHQLQRLKQQQEPWYTVVTNNGDMQPRDLVEVQPRYGGSSQIVSFAEFVRNLADYKPMCIQIDDKPAPNSPQLLP